MPAHVHTGSPCCAQLASAIETLRAHGQRITEPRRAVLNILTHEHGPFTAEQLHTRLKKGECDLVTVYRVLAAFLFSVTAARAEEPATVEAVETEGGAYRFTVDTTEAPDLTAWAHGELIPVLKKWYPLIVGMLPSDGYEAPKTFSVTFQDKYKGVAATAGNHIVCNPAWYRTELKGEAIGSLVHELVHVVQQYRRTHPPGWLVEGIPDYIRWYLYEPESKGCEISASQAAAARHDASYRISANFLNFVIGKYDKDLIREFNAALREGRYDAELWKTRTGHSVEELADEWRKSLEGGATL